MKRALDATYAATASGVRVEEFVPRANVRECSVQIWYDSWRHADRVLRFKGKCYTCPRPTWGADDGENDPRGVLGDYADHPLRPEDADMVGPVIHLCALCANEYDTYKIAQDYSERIWRKPDDESGTDA